MLHRTHLEMSRAFSAGIFFDSNHPRGFAQALDERRAVGAKHKCLQPEKRTLKACNSGSKRML
jgi:hypothetical protein